MAPEIGVTRPSQISAITARLGLARTVRVAESRPEAQARVQR